MYGRQIPILLAKDSRSLFELVIGLSITTEKRLLINLTCLREAYELKKMAKSFGSSGTTIQAMD